MERVACCMSRQLQEVGCWFDLKPVSRLRTGERGAQDTECRLQVVHAGEEGADRVAQVADLCVVHEKTPNVSFAWRDLQRGEIRVVKAAPLS